MRPELLLLMLGDDLLSLVAAGTGIVVVNIGEVVAGQVYINGMIAGEVT